MSDMRLRDTREPMDYVTAVTVHRVESEHQKQAENFLKDKRKEAAEKERLYREALAREIVAQRAAGHPATLARDLARGQPKIAQLAMERTIAEGLAEAAAQSIWRHTANRRDLEQFIEWSKRAAFLDMGEQR